MPTGPLPTNTNKLADRMRSLPPNLASTMTPQNQKEMMVWLMTNFVWPQIWQRLQYEPTWDKLHEMYRVRQVAQESEKRLGSNWRGRTTEENRDREPVKGDDKIADSIIFDTVDRLKNLNFFISWKDGTPVQYNRPRYLATPGEDNFYRPTSDKIKGANALLRYNLDEAKCRLKDMKLKQHLYLYGVGFVHSEFMFKLDAQNFVTEAYTSFEPVSIRKLWLNHTLPVDEMEKQPCPFMFDMHNRAMIMQNQYDPQSNPTGFLNLDNLANAKWPVGQELASWSEALNAGEGHKGQSMINARPEFSTEALWTFYPMIPIDEQGVFNPAGIPTRHIIQLFSNNLIAGEAIPIRIQKLYYPKGQLPIYGCANIPDLDSGLYTPSIGELLENHYHELVKAKQQFLDNKDWINNPPKWHISGSLAANQDCNRPGANIEVTSADEFGWRTPFDATFTTMAFMQASREQAQVTGKAVDAIMGKAMGGRTTATEASNAFQAGMSGVTADVDISNTGIYGGYGERVWDNASFFMDDDLLKRITGAYGVVQLNEEDMQVRVGIKTDVGSTFIESIVKQQHLRYAIEASSRSPALDQPTLWKAFFQELKLHEAMNAVIDNGVEFEINLANEQAIKTYMGEMIVVDPTQNHQIAIKTKTRYLQDIDSKWNRSNAGNPSPMPGPNGEQQTTAQALAAQIQIHQQFQMIQMQQQMLAQQAQSLEEAKPSSNSDNNRPRHQSPVELRGQAASANQ